MSDQQTQTNDDVRERPPAAWLAELEAHTWALHPEVLATLVTLARAGASVSDAVSEATPEALRRRGRPPKINGMVGKVNLKGILMPGGGGLLGMLFGLGDPLQEFRDGFKAAMADDEIGAIIIDIDSPGGVTDHIPEAAAEVRNARGQGKPIIAQVNTLAASAAYWIASQADEIVVTPSGTAGSIGVYGTHRDISKLQDELGIKTTLISAGKFKVEGNPFEPLGEEARGHIQEVVNYYYDAFTADVALGRGVKQSDVMDGFGEGRALPAKMAKTAKLVDRIETLGETVARVASRSRSVPTTTSAEADAGADDTVTAEADEPEPIEGELTHSLALARLEGTMLLQDRELDRARPA